MYSLDGSRTTRFVPHRLIGATLLLSAICLTGSTCGITGGGNPGNLTITAVPTGCGEKLSATQTISWIIHFTVSGGDPNITPIWSFDDGQTDSGTSVVHSFSTASRETANPSDPTSTGQHVPVKFNVTVAIGSNNATQTYDIPMRGTLDGGPDPFGDTCVADDGRTHAPVGTQLCYTVNPPAGGPHYSQANFAPPGPGFYDEAMATERWIHGLEHGAIVLLYDCGGTCTDDFKNQLKALFDAVPPSPRFSEKKMIITRYAGIEPTCGGGTSTFPGSGPFLAIAWDVQRAFDSLDTQGILDFYNRHVDKGPEDVPIAASLTP